MARIGGQEWDELKTILRALVESQSTRRPIRSLVRSYRQSEGQELPLNRFGFDNEFDLIKEMDDTFGVEVLDKHRNYNDYLVYCLSDPNTQHIVDFVANQRHDENEDKEIVKPLPRVFKPKTNTKQIVKSLKPFSLETKECEPNEEHLDVRHGFQEVMLASHWKPRKKKDEHKRIAVCPLPDSTVISNEEKMKIHDLLKRYKTIALSNFGPIYQSVYDNSIDVSRFGCHTLEEFLKRLPQLVRLEPTRNGLTVCLAHVSESVVEKQMVHNISNVKLNSCNDIQRKEVKSSHKSGDNLKQRVEIMSTTYGIPNEINGNHLTNTLIEKKELIGRKDMKRFQQILDMNPKGILPKDFIRQYFKLFNEHIIPSNLGYCSAIEMFASMTDVFYLQKPSNGSTNCDEYLLIKSTPELRAKTISMLPKRRAFDATFRDRAVDVIRRASRGPNASQCLYVDEFSEAYELMYDEVILPKSYGFKNFKDLLICLSKECDIEVKERVKNSPYLVHKSKLY